MSTKHSNVLIEEKKNVCFPRQRPVCPVQASAHSRPAGDWPRKDAPLPFSEAVTTEPATGLSASTVHSDRTCLADFSPLVIYQ